jgi:hypothetical protein
MGFERARVLSALRSANNDIHSATNILLHESWTFTNGCRKMVMWKWLEWLFGFTREKPEWSATTTFLSTVWFVQDLEMACCSIAISVKYHMFDFQVSKWTLEIGSHSVVYTRFVCYQLCCTPATILWYRLTVHPIWTSVR